MKTGMLWVGGEIRCSKITCRCEKVFHITSKYTKSYFYIFKIKFAVACKPYEYTYTAADGILRFFYIKSLFGGPEEGWGWENKINYEG